MLTQANPFTWFFAGDKSRKDLSIHRNIYGKFCVQRQIAHTPRHFTVETLSSHDTLEQAAAAAEAL